MLKWLLCPVLPLDPTDSWWFHWVLGKSGWPPIVGTQYPHANHLRISGAKWTWWAKRKAFRMSKRSGWFGDFQCPSMGLEYRCQTWPENQGTGGEIVAGKSTINDYSLVDFPANHNHVGLPEGQFIKRRSTKAATHLGDPLSSRQARRLALELRDRRLEVCWDES